MTNKQGHSEAYSLFQLIGLGHLYILHEDKCTKMQISLSKGF